MNTYDHSVFPAPCFSKSVYKLSRLVIHPYLRLAMGVKGIIINNREYLHTAFTTPYPLIVAFRHTAKEDAPVLLAGVKETHLRFLYGRDVLYWAGKATQFLFPRLGFVAVQNRGNNREGMQFLRNEMAHPVFPLALAPEGQVTYHMYKTSNLQPGIASLASWAIEGAGGVTILPISIGYRYAELSEQWVKSLLQRWERKSGLSSKGETLQDMLNHAMESMLEYLATTWNLADNPQWPFPERRDAICKGLLTLSEQEAGLMEDQGTILDRLYRIRFKGTDTLFDPCVSEASPEREAERKTAKRYLWRNQIVDILEYLDPSYLMGKHYMGRAAECALNLLDLVNRIQGGTIDTRYSPRSKKAYIQMGKPLHFTQNAFPNPGRKSQQKHILLTVGDALQHCSKDLETILGD